MNEDFLLGEGERKHVYEEEYKKECSFADTMGSMALSSINWREDRPADRKRYFCSAYMDRVQEVTAKAQLAHCDPLIRKDERAKCEAEFLERFRKLFKRLDGIIYYRMDAPYKTTIDWDKYNDLKREGGIA